MSSDDRPIPSRPNLFHFAPSELSQDAFIAWLLSWADPRHAEANSSLHRAALNMLDTLLERCSVRKPDRYRSVIVGRQYRKIDVVVVVNGDIAIGIEDKTHTSEHSDQLQRYRNILAGAFRPENVAAVYLKTGDQGDYSEVEKAGYIRFARTDFLRALRVGIEIGVDNDIYIDFVQHLERHEAAVSSFSLVPLHQWNKDPRRWAGFFMTLRERLGDGNWKYVPNKSGGFMGFYWHWRGPHYLQLEEDKLCFKVEVIEESQREVTWERWHEKLMRASDVAGVSLKRPPRRSGRWMTVAVLAYDYRQMSEDGILSLDDTIALLRGAERLMDDAIMLA